MIGRREELVAAWIEGDLDPAEAVRADLEVSANPHLLRVAARMRATRERLVVHGPVSAPASLMQRVETAIEFPALEAQRDRRWVAAMVGVGALVGAMLAASWLVLNREPPPPPVVAASVADAAVLVPPGWVLITTADPSLVEREVTSVGATWSQVGELVSLGFDASLARGVEQRLSSLGTLVPEGEPVPRAGRLRSVLTLRVPEPEPVVTP